MKYIQTSFSTPMVQALLEGRKTQTRRVNGLKEINQAPSTWALGTVQMYSLTKKVFGAWFRNLNGFNLNFIKCPYGQPGDVLWVREAFHIATISPYIFKADNWVGDMGWKPSIHMPKVACRIWLKVKGVRVERLQYITEEDAACEGLIGCTLDTSRTARTWFQNLWITINGQGSFFSNPWVWVVEFERCDKPEGF